MTMSIVFCVYLVCTALRIDLALLNIFLASTLYKSIAGRDQPVNHPDGPIRPAIDLCRMLIRLLCSFSEAWNSRLKVMLKTKSSGYVLNIYVFREE